MKKSLILPILLLTSCGSPASTVESSTSTGDPVSDTPISDVSISEVPTSLEPLPDYVSPISVPSDTSEVLNFEFGGLSGNELDGFFNIGWSTVNSKFNDLDLRLIDDEGFLRTPELEISKTKLYVVMKSHITGLNALNASALGKSMTLTVSGLDTDGNVVDDSSYSHTITNLDIAYQQFNDFPAYSSDFSKNPYIVELEGENIVKVRVELVNKISFTGDNGKSAGCNFAIKNLTILE